MRLLDLATLTSLVSALPRFGTFSYSASVESTNAVALERLYTNDSFGISFVTETQTHGRGRAGRSWVSPAGSGLYASTILPAELPGRCLPAVGFWASLAVREAVIALTDLQLDLKWPNDMLWQGRKCVGILSQSRWNGEAARVVVGVGVNVNRPGVVDPALAAQAVWLSEAGAREYDRTALLARVLTIYEREFDRLLERPENVIEDWARVARLKDTRIAVKAIDGSVLQAGTVVGVDKDGALLLQTADGEVRVALGDVDALPD